VSDATMHGSMSEQSTAVTIGALMPWWLVLVQGLIALFVGVMLFTNTAVTTVVLVSILGWYWLFMGLFQLGSLFVDRTQWGWRLASGLLGIMAGAYIIAAPLIGTAVVLGVTTIILGVNGMIIGALDLGKAFKGGGWGIGILGALSFVIGFAIAFNAPKYMLALPWVWGIFAVVAGVMAIIGSFQLRKVQKA